MAEKEKKENFSRDEVQKMIAEAVAKALAESKTGNVIHVKTDEYVTVTYIGPMAPGTVFDLGDWGKINRSGGTLKIPKEKFLQGIDYRMEERLEERKLIVLNGLTEEEMERYGVKYRAGELMTERIYANLCKLSSQDLISIFGNLCEWHKKTFANTIESDYFEKGSSTIDVDTLKTLNNMSRSVDKKGLFRHMLDDIGQKLSSEEG